MVYMRHYPREIEADLLFRGVDIYDWHQGRMCSARLLALIEALPDDSAYWRERRDGDWSERQYMDAILINEIRSLRADQVSIHCGSKMDISWMKSPAQTEDVEDLSEKRAAARADIMGQLTGEKG